MIDVGSIVIQRGNDLETAMRYVVVSRDFLNNALSVRDTAGRVTNGLSPDMFVKVSNRKVKPLVLIKTAFGREFKINITKALEAVNIEYTTTKGDGNHITNFLVQESDKDKAHEAINAYYEMLDGVK